LFFNLTVVPAQYYKFSYGANHQLLNIYLASVAGLDGILLPAFPQYFFLCDMLNSDIIPLKNLNSFVMTILQIEHQVPNYDGWKKAFDSDPIDREKSGVKSYCVYRPTDNPNYVVIDLEFDDFDKAQMTLNALKSLWTKMEGTVMVNPKTRILDVVDFKEYE
jgi:hypothetical protein